jgi:hypothetical protein
VAQKDFDTLLKDVRAFSQKHGVKIGDATPEG